MGILGLFSDEHKSNSTTSSNTSNTTYSSDSHNVATNTTNNSTVNDTNTLTQDRRTVNDHGIGISADNSTVSMFQSGNTTENYTSVSTDYGSVMGGLGLASAGIASNSSIAGKAIDVSTALAHIGADMQNANIAFLQHVGDQNAAAARSAISEVVTASGNALNQVSAIAAKPLNANDPQRLVIIVALGVVGLVFFSKMKG